LELDQLRQTTDRIVELLWTSEVLRSALASYVLDLREACRSAMERNRPQDSQTWDRVLEALPKTLFVLCDRDLLADLLNDFMQRALHEGPSSDDVATLAIAAVPLTGAPESGQSVTAAVGRFIPAPIGEADWVRLRVSIGRGTSTSEGLGDNWDDFQREARELLAYDACAQVSQVADPESVIVLDLFLRTRPPELAARLHGAAGQRA
jgi:hypothetical protein